MKPHNLRHLRIYLAVGETGAITAAAARLNISQPAATQAVAKLEAQAGGALFTRTRRGFAPTRRGRLLTARVTRALGMIDPALAAISSRLALTATSTQLRALAAVHQARNFTQAARQLGLAQPTVHRAVSQLEQEAGQPLFDRTPFGLVPTRATDSITQAARLAFAELDQATADLAEFDGRDGGQITLGALPLARSVLVPQALAAFRRQRAQLPIRVIDGPYADLMTGLRGGEIDMIFGALRDEPPFDDVLQEELFTDRLAIIARPGHPLAGRADLAARDLQALPWVAPRAGTPTRDQFNLFFRNEGLSPPDSIIETGSLLMMREVLAASNMLGCVSKRQASVESAAGLVVTLPVDMAWQGRRIGLSYRSSWMPTPAQSLLRYILRDLSRAAPFR